MAGTFSFVWIGSRSFEVVGDDNDADLFYVADESRVPLMDVFICVYGRLGANDGFFFFVT